jgi:hypothetical protein
MYDLDTTVSQPFGIAMVNNLIPGKVVLRDVGFISFSRYHGSIITQGLWYYCVNVFPRIKELSLISVNVENMIYPNGVSTFLVNEETAAQSSGQLTFYLRFANF